MSIKQRYPLKVKHSRVCNLHCSASRMFSFSAASRDSSPPPGAIGPSPQYLAHFDSELRGGMARSQWILVAIIVGTTDAGTQVGDSTNCLGNSVCGFLQANSRGISSVQYCSCSKEEGFAEGCPLDWDSEDGQSITQADADQYKYCGLAPSLPTCRSADQVAYTSRQVYAKDTGHKVAMKDEVKCICPRGATFGRHEYEFMDEEGAEIIVINYFCSELPPCESDAVCKTVTEKANEFIVKSSCSCPGLMICPTEAETGVERTQFHGGIIHNIRCQTPAKLVSAEVVMAELGGLKQRTNRNAGLKLMNWRQQFRRFKR